MPSLLLRVSGEQALRTLPLSPLSESLPDLLAALTLPEPGTEAGEALSANFSIVHVTPFEQDVHLG